MLQNVLLPALLYIVSNTQAGARPSNADQKNFVEFSDKDIECEKLKDWETKRKSKLHKNKQMRRSSGIAENEDFASLVEEQLRKASRRVSRVLSEAAELPAGIGLAAAAAAITNSAAAEQKSADEQAALLSDDEEIADQTNFTSAFKVGDPVEVDYVKKGPIVKRRGTYRRAVVRAARPASDRY